MYESQGQVPLVETAPLGDSHRAAGFQTYSISKIAAEALVSHTASRLDMPTVIARLSVPYGDTFGWQSFQLMMVERDIPIGVHPDAPSLYAPLHLVDIVGSLPYLLAAAAVPATIVNWGGDENVSVEEWTALIGDLVGKEPVMQIDENAIPSLPLDVTRLERPRLPLHGVVAGRHPPSGGNESRRGEVAEPGGANRPRPEARDRGSRLPATPRTAP